MRKHLLLVPVMLLFFTNVMAEVAPVKVIGATTVDTMAAKGLLDKGIAFVDARGAEKYNEGHIPGAKNLSVADLTPEALSALVKKTDRVVFYCTGVPCMASSKMAKQALEWGWTSVFYYRTGMSSWKRSGLPIEK